MNKIKAIWYTLLIILLYWIAKPLSCAIVATVKSRLMNLGFWKEIFVDEWKTSDLDVEVYWRLITELWRS